LIGRWDLRRFVGFVVEGSIRIVASFVTDIVQFKSVHFVSQARSTAVGELSTSIDQWRDGG
jgi:hypothetical protein